MAVDLAVDLYPSEMKRIYQHVLPALNASAMKVRDRDRFPEEVRERFASMGLKADVVSWSEVYIDGVKQLDDRGEPLLSPEITISGRITEESEHDYDRMQYEVQAQHAAKAGNPDVRRKSSVAMPNTGKLWTPGKP